MTKTRFPALLYSQVTRGLWRFIDAETLRAVGPHYKTRTELLGDLERFAELFCGPQALSEGEAK